MNSQSVKMVDQLGFNDISELPKVESLLKVLKIDSSYVELDLTNCLIDYPATSQVIDTILFKLESIDKDRNLLITTDFLFPHDTLLNALLSGSKYFSLEDLRINSLKEIEARIRSKTARTGLKLQIRVVSGPGNIIHEYEYS
jgi:hypothetical protein